MQRQSLGQEFSAFSKQIENAIKSIEDSLKFILEIALEAPQLEQV